MRPSSYARPQLDIQLVDEGKNLNETAAGRQLREDMAKAEEKHREELRQAKEEMVEALRAKDLELAEDLKKSSEQLARKLRQMDCDKVRLESDLQMQLRQRLRSKCQQTRTQNRSVFFGALTGGLYACWIGWRRQSLLLAD